MKIYLPAIFILVMLAGCRTDTGSNEISGHNYISPFDLYYFTSPAAGVTWKPGTYQVITWKSNKDTNPVDIYIVKKKIYNETLIAKDYPNSGSCNWYVPVDIPLSNHYQIRISESGKPNNVDYSEVFFIK